MSLAASYACQKSVVSFDCFPLNLLQKHCGVLLDSWFAWPQKPQQSSPIAPEKAWHDELPLKHSNSCMHCTVGHSEFSEIATLGRPKWNNCHIWDFPASLAVSEMQTWSPANCVTAQRRSWTSKEKICSWRLFSMRDDAIGFFAEGEARTVRRLKSRKDFFGDSLKDGTQ